MSISSSGAPWLVMEDASGDKVLKLAVECDGPCLLFEKKQPGVLVCTAAPVFVALIVDSWRAGDGPMNSAPIPVLKAHILIV
jgi:hypothetical protein